MKTKNKTVTLDQFKEKHYGKRGTVKREKLEKGYNKFMMKQLNLSITL